DLVNAQQARRILDRLVGFELSGILWRKVRAKLSAGRVQSVTVKLVVERERDIQAFDPKPYYKVVARFNVKNEQGRNVVLKADLASRFEAEADAQSFLDRCVAATYQINDIVVKPTKRRPTAPFTTSTLQQEASRKLGFSVRRTMSNAQRLYEQGLITYMRTDSVALSETALSAIADEITTSYGKEYVHTRRFKGKKELAQEAHEAIRPSYIDRKVVTQDRDQQRLYELIWKRTIASQMADAELEKTTVSIGISTVPDAKLVALGEVLKFDGFLKVYLESKDDDDEEDESGILPPLKVGQQLDLSVMTATERFTRAPARFTEASLVKKLEELGIGRPSTYAPTISKIMEPDRGYVVKESREGVERNYNVFTLKDGAVNKKVETEITGATSNRLYPTDMGMIVSDFLSKHFDEIMNYSFTADIEKKFDHIAQGGEQWTRMLKGFYDPFHSVVEDTLENAERASGERILGTDPETGNTVLVRMSRFGPVVQIGAQNELSEEEKPRYANLRPGQSMETISHEEAMELFKLPKTLGQYNGLDVTVAVGRYGPYVKYDEMFVSIPRGSDPLEVTLEEAKVWIDEKKKADAPVGQYKGLDITKGKGRFGPFLKWNGLFVNIPRRYDPETISTDEMHELIKIKEEKEANRYIKQWPEDNLALENGRWGPFIRFKKKSIKLPRIDDKRMTSEQAAEMTLEQVKELVEAEIPGAFAKKKKRATKKK
ncbi:MAG: DNA topoisomerase, partial [Bacteroidota bacterium]